MATSKYSTISTPTLQFQLFDNFLSNQRKIHFILKKTALNKNLEKYFIALLKLKVK
jgi:hypothetical protein